MLTESARPMEKYREFRPARCDNNLYSSGTHGHRSKISQAKTHSMLMTVV